MGQYFVAAFDAHFAGAYREHVFLSHDLVPESTRQSRTKPYIIKSKTPFIALQNTTQNEALVTFTPANQSVGATPAEIKTLVTFTPANQSEGATPAEIREWFGDLTAKVLVFDHLYAAFAGFDNADGFRNIQRRLKQGLQRCKYRQWPC